VESVFHSFCTRENPHVRFQTPAAQSGFAAVVMGSLENPMEHRAGGENDG
jgi:hypothetical protein